MVILVQPVVSDGEDGHQIGQGSHCGHHGFAKRRRMEEGRMLFIGKVRVTLFFIGSA